MWISPVFFDVSTWHTGLALTWERWCFWLCTFPLGDLSLSGGFSLVGPQGHLQGQNIESCNLFSPVMMITWWRKLGGNLPRGHDTLLYSISGTGSFICPVAQTRLDIPRPVFTQSWSTGGGGSQSAPAKGRFEPLTCRSTDKHANHQTMMTAPSRRIKYKLGPQLYVCGGSKHFMRQDGLKMRILKQHFKSDHCTSAVSILWFKKITYFWNVGFFLSGIFSL